MRLIDAGLLLVCVALFVLGVRTSRALPLAPVAGACYASDGVTVETTWLGGSGDYAYPSPSEGTITRYDDGSFTVTHRTLFVPVVKRHVYLPTVQR
jgi:hypothetical protein